MRARSSGRGAGPSKLTPVMRKPLPWHGHLNLFSADRQFGVQPRCVQVTMQRVEAAARAARCPRASDEPDAELLLPALVDAHAVLVREAGLELLRRLVEHVREHETAGRGERGGRGGRKRAPRQAHPGAARQQRRGVVGIARGRFRGCGRRGLRRRAAGRRGVGRLAGEIRNRRGRRPRRRRRPCGGRGCRMRRGRGVGAALPARSPVAPAAGARVGSGVPPRSPRRFAARPSARTVSGFDSSAMLPYPITFSASIAAWRTFMLRSCWLRLVDRWPSARRPSAPPPRADR